jgi:hypothetical protein
MLEIPLEGSGYKSYPVKTVAIRIAWILDQPEGVAFLWSIYKNENLSYYKIPTVYLIVEFLYNKYKNILLQWLMPTFIVQAVFIQAMVVCLEYYAKVLLENKTEVDGVQMICGNEESRPFKIAAIFFLVLSWMLGVFLFYSYFLLLKNMGRDYFSSFYNILDITKILLLITTTVLTIYQLFNDESLSTWEEYKSLTKARRNLEAILIFLLYVKAGYYMSLIDATAPLIDNISEVIFDIRYFIFILII